MADVEVSCSDNATYQSANDGIANLVDDGEHYFRRLKTFLHRSIERAGSGGSEQYQITYMNREQKGPVDMARMLYQERRLRDSIFNVGLTFSEPAWDILLDLFVNGARGKQISITSACIAANVPPTTALRWLKQLESLDLLIRQEDINDKRRSYISLSSKGNELMLAFFNAQYNKPSIRK